MKKLCFLLAAVLLVLTLAGCHRPAPQPTQPATVPTSPATQPPTVPTDPPTQPPATVPPVYPEVVGIYIPADDGSRDRVLLTEFSGKRTAKKDIDCFEIFASTQARLPGGSFADMWRDAWDAHGSHPETKIGFHISFPLASGQVIQKTLLKPSDSQDFYEYLEIYLYDDVNQDGGWYTHLDDEDMEVETIISSIKLTAGSRIDQVGDITLTAFLYNSPDCFDSQGDYIGPVSESIVIYG